MTFLPVFLSFHISGAGIRSRETRGREAEQTDALPGHAADWDRAVLPRVLPIFFSICLLNLSKYFRVALQKQSTYFRFKTRNRITVQIWRAQLLETSIPPQFLPDCPNSSIYLVFKVPLKVSEPRDLRAGTSKIA